MATGTRSVHALLTSQPISATLRGMLGIDLFAGAGGMSLGAKMAGIRVGSAVEIDAAAAATHAINFPNTNVRSEDIRNIIPDSLVTKRRSVPLVVFGGPPCKGFSTSNQRTRSAGNPSNWLFLEYLRIVQALKPEWVVIENVKGILETEKGFFLDQILSSLERVGYRTAWQILNAADFGIPQRRNRLFIVGTTERCIRYNFPSPMDGKPHSVQDAIHDLPVLDVGAMVDRQPYSSAAKSSYARELRGKAKSSTNHLVSRNSNLVIERYKFIPEGGNWMDIPPHLMKNYSDKSRCHTGIYYRLKRDEPAIVIGNYRKNMLIHPTENRGLSVREAARIQSFPDAFRFCGSIGFQQEQVGNAVPPRLAFAVFSSISEHYDLAEPS